MNNVSFIKARVSPYLARRWLVFYGYLVILLIATPYLPLVINRARAKWQGGSVASFVLGAEIGMGIALILLASSVHFINRSKFQPFILIISGLVGASCLFYHIVPNPYELTHLPEYALFSVLLIHAMKPSSYLHPAAITVIVGAADELYQGLLPLRFFNWYDIVLNGLGGVLGLTIYWGIVRK